MALVRTGPACVSRRYCPTPVFLTLLKLRCRARRLYELFCNIVDRKISNNAAVERSIALKYSLLNLFSEGARHVHA